MLADGREAAIADSGIERYEAEVRVVDPDGTVRWLRLLCHPRIQLGRSLASVVGCAPESGAQRG